MDHNAEEPDHIIYTRALAEIFLNNFLCVTLEDFCFIHVIILSCPVLFNISPSQY